jgi:hypothetical protein
MLDHDQYATGRCRSEIFFFSIFELPLFFFLSWAIPSNHAPGSCGTSAVVLRLSFLPAQNELRAAPRVSSVPGIEHDGTNNLPFFKKTGCFGGLAQRKVHR